MKKNNNFNLMNFIVFSLIILIFSQLSTYSISYFFNLKGKLYIFNGFLSIFSLLYFFIFSSASFSFDSISSTYLIRSRVTYFESYSSFNKHTSLSFDSYYFSFWFSLRDMILVVHVYGFLCTLYLISFMKVTCSHK